MTERHDGYDIVKDGDPDAPPVTVVTDQMRERMVAAMDEMYQRNVKLLELGFASTRALNDFFKAAEAERVWAVGQLGGGDARGPFAVYILLMYDLANAFGELLVAEKKRRPVPSATDPTSPYSKISVVMEVEFPNLKEKLLRS